MKLTDRLRDNRERFIFQGGSEFAVGLADRIDQLEAQIAENIAQLDEMIPMAEKMEAALAVAKDALESAKAEIKATGESEGVFFGEDADVEIKVEQALAKINEVTGVE